MRKISTSLPLSLLVAALMVGCAGQEQKSAVATVVESATQLNNDDLYEVHHDGRIYIFDDVEGYHAFLNTYEAPYRLTRIGAGPHGETLVFGLRDEDKKKQSGIASVDMNDGVLAAADSFYGEIRMDGRIYVFTDLALMKETRGSGGHIAYRYTDIGAGPKGETVVYALTSEQKKHRPDQTIARFNASYPR